jgi:hypothetical protein
MFTRQSAPNLLPSDELTIVPCEPLQHELSLHHDTMRAGMIRDETNALLIAHELLAVASENTTNMLWKRLTAAMYKNLTGCDVPERHTRFEAMNNTLPSLNSVTVTTPIKRGTSQ